MTKTLADKTKGSEAENHNPEDRDYDGTLRAGEEENWNDKKAQKEGLDKRGRPEAKRK